MSSTRSSSSWVEVPQVSRDTLERLKTCFLPGPERSEGGPRMMVLWKPAAPIQTLARLRPDSVEGSDCLLGARRTETFHPLLEPERTIALIRGSMGNLPP